MTVGKDPGDFLLALRNRQDALGDGTLGGRVLSAAPVRSGRRIGTLREVTPQTSNSGFVLGDGVAKITVSSTAPTSPTVGDLWVDTT